MGGGDGDGGDSNGGGDGDVDNEFLQSRRNKIRCCLPHTSNIKFSSISLCVIANIFTSTHPLFTDYDWCYSDN